jgi:hypothetical protein
MNYGIALRQGSAENFIGQVPAKIYRCTPVGGKHLMPSGTQASQAFASEKSGRSGEQDLHRATQPLEDGLIGTVPSASRDKVHSGNDDAESDAISAA